MAQPNQANNSNQQNNPNNLNNSVENAARYLSSMKVLWHTPVIKQIVFILGIAVGVALGFAIYSSIKEPIYSPLDYQVTQQNVATITDTLDKAGIKYMINEQDGLVYVDSEDVSLARLKLAAAGVAKDDNFSFAYLNDQSSIGSSQFLENARYLRALEADLAKTINAIDGVSGARVHIAIPRNNVFADENKYPTASVVVNLGLGMASDREKIRAIAQIVANSVPGLDPNHVSITDQYGHYLSSALDKDSIFNSDALNYQTNVQNYYEKRIESMIAPIVGSNKVNVRVNATLDFTQEEEAHENYDPKDQVIRSEQDIKQKDSAGSASGAPGSLSNTPPEGGAQAPSAQSGGSDQRSETVKNYEIGKTVSYKKITHPKLVNLSVAVIVDDESVYDPKTKKMVTKPISQAKLNKITELVKATIGYDQKRGDNVTVVNSNFATPTTNIVTASLPVWDMPWFWDAIKRILGISLGFVLLFTLYKRLRAYMRTIQAPPPVQRPRIGYEGKTLDDEIQDEMHEAKQEKIDRLKEMAETDPDRVAIILKNWVGKH